MRIAPSETETAHARRTVAVARWQESENYPAVRALPFDQPIVIDGHAATFWEAVSPVGNEWVLYTGVIHGNADAANALRDWNGQPVMIDLDSFAIGRREWDVIVTAVYYDSFGWHTKEE